MAAVGAEVAGSWILSSGAVAFFVVLLLLSIFITALCTDCRRHSFDLRDPEVDKNPSSLIRVVKLEETRGARENPMINEIQNDEKDVQTSASVSKAASEAETSGDENPVPFVPWRSHLGATSSHGGWSSSNGGSGGGSGSSGGSVSGGGSGDGTPATNHKPGPESAADLSEGDSTYARISKREKRSMPAVSTPEVEQVEEEEEEEESPPLPDRSSQLDV